ncbi:hypothetical protein A4A49_03856 [Nicotiana attenuata]|uniref:Complex 1 LYR protein domain-containing protein n=1 Tax=Nicotiana attenuata TaxID=49451 RepID=A0A1J6IHB7_NICAT|nr:hypothetical protein A4A49_03856 [Nicotiana attenuata]
MGASSGPRLSGMQKQVLALYRGFLRAARSKPVEERKQIESIVSAEFHKNSKQVDRICSHYESVVILIRLSWKVAGLCAYHEGLIPPLLARDVNMMTRLLACG